MSERMMDKWRECHDEVVRLRAELAAEKKLSGDIANAYGERMVEEAVERCAKIAEGWSPFTPNSHTATNIAAAIRASNAKGEAVGAIGKKQRHGENFSFGAKDFLKKFGVSNAAPPQGEKA